MLKWVSCHFLWCPFCEVSSLHSVFSDDGPLWGPAEVVSAAWLQLLSARVCPACCSGDEETSTSSSGFSVVSSPSEHGSHSSCSSLSVEPCTAIWGTRVNLLITGTSSSTSSLVWGCVTIQSVLCCCGCCACVWAPGAVVATVTVVLVFSSGSSKLTSCTASCFLKESRLSDRLSFLITTSCSDLSIPESLILWLPMYPPSLLWSVPM